jgi:hypothetical protein
MINNEKGVESTTPKEPVDTKQTGHSPDGEWPVVRRTSENPDELIVSGPRHHGFI